MDTLDIFALGDVRNSDLARFPSYRLRGNFYASYVVIARLTRILPSRKLSDHVRIEVFPAPDSSSRAMFSKDDCSFAFLRELSQCSLMAVIAFSTSDDDKIRLCEMFEVRYTEAVGMGGGHCRTRITSPWI